MEPVERTCALLLTDIVDSTRLTQRLAPAALASLWAAHDRQARDLLPGWRGREIDKTDGMLLLFDAADDALGYALDYHRALAGLAPPLRARAGLHFGPLHLRENPAADVARGAKPIEAEGLAKPLAARVMATALGGQTLLSADAVAALEASPAGPARWALRAHGHWQLKGIEAPVELVEAVPPGESFNPPADTDKSWRVVRQGSLWLPARQMRMRLPPERDGFVGREAALTQLARALDGGARLLSVVGSGGSGKTRLAQQFGWRWLGDWPGGVWFCDLSSARDLDGLLGAVASTLQLMLTGDDAVSRIGMALHGHDRCLVILDNFEQVARHAAQALEPWLDAAPQASFIVTSRERLGLQGEQVLALAPMAPHEACALLRLRSSGGAAAGLDPAGDDADARALVELLDCLPLAVELAAARLHEMPAALLAARMRERFKLLKTGGAQQGRQSTLKATLDWSWDLLSGRERSALAQLSVFEGGIAADAAVGVLALPREDGWPERAGGESGTGPAGAVHGSAGTSHSDVPTVLGVLVDKSLLQFVGEGRWDLLASVRDYAAQRLREPVWPAAGAREMVIKRHARWFGARYAGLGVADPGQELTNVIAACRGAARLGMPESAIGALEGAVEGLSLRGPLSAALELVARCRRVTEAAGPAQRTAVELQAGRVLANLGQNDRARQALRGAAELAAPIGDQLREGWANYHLGVLEQRCAQADPAADALQRALSCIGEEAAPMLHYRALNARAVLISDLGRNDEAAADLERALALGDRLGERHWRSQVLCNLGAICMEQGRLDEAGHHLRNGLDVAIATGSRANQAGLLSNLGLLRLDSGDAVAAAALLEQATTIARESGRRENRALYNCQLGEALIALGRLDEAQAVLRDALVEARTVARPYFQADALAHLARIEALRGRHGPAHTLADEALQIARAQDYVYGIAGVLASVAEVAMASGDNASAGACADEAEALLRGVGCGANALAMRVLQRLRERLP